MFADIPVLSKSRHRDHSDLDVSRDCLLQPSAYSSRILPRLDPPKRTLIYAYVLGKFSFLAGFWGSGVGWVWREESERW